MGRAPLARIATTIAATFAAIRHLIRGRSRRAYKYYGFSSMMCSECGEDHDELQCAYCGVGCYGSCQDPDTCPTCWIHKLVPDDDLLLDFEALSDAEDKCMSDCCICECHEEMYFGLGMRVEAGVLRRGRLQFERVGVFPFLTLPGEIRDKIYGYAFLQDGIRRRSHYHRGTIHSALLSTCRQIYREAGNLPITINRLNFSGPLHALDFLGFRLTSTKRSLVTTIHIEYHVWEFSNPSWEPLIRELSKMSITHLSLTVMGQYPKQAFLGHTCFTDRFKLLKDLQAFDLVLTSASLTDTEKNDIVEQSREKIIKGYVRPKKSGSARLSKSKRAVIGEGSSATNRPVKKVKCTMEKLKYQTNIIVSPRSRRLGLKSQKPEREAAKAVREGAKQSLLAQYERIKRYATSIDLDTAPVKIRLEKARKTAEDVDKREFEKIAHSILLTLEERYHKIFAARLEAPHYRLPTPTPEPSSSEESYSSEDNYSSDSRDSFPLKAPRCSII